MYKNKAPQVLVIFLILAALLGCKSQPVYNVENEPFTVRPNATLEQIQEAIIKGCKKAEWRPQVLGPGKMVAVYSYKDNKYGALVDITFDRDSFDIKYRSSSANLKYMEHTPKSGGGFFAGLFDKDSGQQAPGTTVTIHKAYNKWVKELEESINASLAAMPTQPTAVATTAPAPAPPPQVIAPEPKTSKHREYSEPKPRAVINCDSKPDTVLSGQGVITKSTAKLRYGANNQCPSAGSVARNEVFTLLGAKDNWFYIQTAQNQVAWIYAPLVKKVDPNAPPPPEPVKKADVAPQVAPTQPAALNAKEASTPPAPPQPATVRKKISIAVIQFKTLNKEAQEIALGDLVSETFTSALVNSSAFKIIEREQLDKVIKEMELSQTGFIETSNAVAIGKMLHADAIITGSVALLGKQIQLNARIIDIESAYVISAETRTTGYTLDNVSKIAREIVSSLSQKLNN